jgi:hypothetical protein
MFLRTNRLGVILNKCQIISQLWTTIELDVDANDWVQKDILRDNLTKLFDIMAAKTNGIRMENSTNSIATLLEYLMSLQFFIENCIGPHNPLVIGMNSDVPYYMISSTSTSTPTPTNTTKKTKNATPFQPIMNIFSLICIGGNRDVDMRFLSANFPSLQQKLNGISFVKRLLACFHFVYDIFSLFVDHVKLSSRSACPFKIELICFYIASAYHTYDKWIQSKRDWIIRYRIHLIITLSGKLSCTPHQSDAITPSVFQATFIDGVTKFIYTKFYELIKAFDCCECDDRYKYACNSMFLLMLVDTELLTTDKRLSKFQITPPNETRLGYITIMCNSDNDINAQLCQNPLFQMPYVGKSQRLDMLRDAFLTQYHRCMC